MKKILALLLAAMMAVTFTACTIEMEETSQQEDEDEEDKDKDKDKEKDKKDEDEEKDEDKNNADEDKADGDGLGEATIAQTVIYDENDVKITAKELIWDEWFGYQIKVLIENNTDEDLSFSLNTSTVNGYMVGTSLWADAAAGKKVNDEISINEYDLAFAGITHIADVELEISAINEDYDEVLNTGMLSIKTSIADKYNYTYDDSGEVLFNEGGIKIVSKGLMEDPYGDQCLGLYIHNDTENDIYVDVEDLSVNGYMVSGWLYADVLPGKHIVTYVEFYSSDLEDNDIETIEDVEFVLDIRDNATYDEIATSDIISLFFE